VKYLRSLSFIQGTSVNALRTSILFLMLYLIFRQEITIGQFFSLLLYSFFIFGPLQELGNVINTFRETEVSLQNFQDILDTPRDPKTVDPVPIDIDDLTVDQVTFQHHSANTCAMQIEFSAARMTDRVRGAVGREQNDLGEATGRPVWLSPGKFSITAFHPLAWILMSCAKRLGLSRRIRNCFRARFARIFSSLTQKRQMRSAWKFCRKPQ
jgi:ABC-type multidrug transport system fused ATPase/permease subunit